MSTAEKLPSVTPIYAELLEMTLTACKLARESAAATAGALARMFAAKPISPMSSATSDWLRGRDSALTSGAVE